MKWFKFYGQDYLTDPKMLALSGSERSCWITLLSYGSVNDNGMITFLSEEQLMIQSGISFTDEEWDNTKGILKKLESLEMICIDNGKITILNWGKRQETSLTPYERVKKYREKHKNDNAVITLDKIRVDKKRIDKEALSDKSDAFDQFWNSYPKKELKKRSKEIWNRKGLDSKLTEILSFIAKASLTDRWKQGFIKQPPAFLNGECWNDDLKAYGDTETVQKTAKERIVNGIKEVFMEGSGWVKQF